MQEHKARMRADLTPMEINTSQRQGRSLGDRRGCRRRSIGQAEHLDQEAFPQMCARKRNHVSKKRALRRGSGTVPLLRACGLGVVVVLAAAAAVPSRRSRPRRPRAKARPRRRKTPGRSARASFWAWAGCRMPNWLPRAPRFSARAAAFVTGRMLVAARGPDLLRSPVVLDDNQGELVGPTVRDGRPAKGMPAFRFVHR